MESRPEKKARVDATAAEDGEKGPYFSLGGNTYKVYMSLHKENRTRLVAAMKAVGASGVIVLKGGEAVTRHDTDHEEIFRQESYFQWCFGVKEPDMYGSIDIDTGAACLFIPRMPETVEPWIGAIEPPESFKKRYDVDSVAYTDEVEKNITAAAASGHMVHVLYGMNSDSKNFAEPAALPSVPDEMKKKDLLFQVIANLRVFKTPAELALMKYVSNVSSAAHVDVMRNVRAGMGEFQMESLFNHYIYYRGGCRHTAYTCICACGPSAATLHYGHAGAPNDRKLSADDIALLDMGAEYHCYASDITCSYPVSGKFNDKQRIIYEGVLDAVKAVETAMKPGVSWPDMHRLAARCVLANLLKHGLLVGDLDEMDAANLGATFMPHGLGHLIGLDTHDVGGYLDADPKRIDEGPFGLKNLRTARVLQPRMCFTVEPGCYFVTKLIEKAQADPKLNRFLTPKIADYKNFGGVRIEDVVTVTDSGIENFTLCPRTMDEIESVMAGGSWPPEKDTAPWLKRQWATPVPSTTYTSWGQVTGRGTAEHNCHGTC
eukprot:m.82240 g.82240  ORF g.82240 m.82240 type:complete len:545 (-) comp16322_c0_seq3:170-1804(-)